MDWRIYEDKQTKEETIIEVVYIDHIKMLMLEYEDNKTWIEEYVKNNKPKKKINKKQIL